MARDGEKLFHWCDVDGRILTACVEYTNSHRWQVAMVSKAGRGQYSPSATCLDYFTSMDVMEHWILSRIRVESRTRKAIAMAVEMVFLLERGRAVSNSPGRDSLESLRPLDMGTSCKGISSRFVLEGEGAMKRAIALRKKKKVNPNMKRRMIED